MVQFWVGMRRLTAHWKPLILFEILWKLVTLLVIAPACAGLIQLAIHLAKLKYLTTSNLLQFLRSPWTILLLAVLLLLAALYTLFEIAAVCTCFRQSRFQKVRTTLGRMVRSGLQSVLHFFRGGGPFLVLHLLVLIPLMQFSATSGIFTAMGIPDFLAYYMTKKEFLLPIYVAAIILCCLLSVRWVFSSVLVVMHDSNLKRTTGVNKDIWDVDYADIQDLDAGSWFDPAYANARIPTLEETLQFVDKRAKLNIEIKPTKHGSDTLEQDVAELITRYQYTDACYVTSFSYGSLKKVKEANPEIRTGYLMSVAYGQFYSLKYADAFSLNKVFVTSQVVNAAHQQGKQIFAWTVNGMSEVRSLCNLHVDSIITDDPVMVQNVISRDSTGETLRSVLDYFIN